MPVKGELLYFRGRRNLDAIFRSLSATTELDKATEVLVTGCSAGGLAVLLHGDRIRGLLRSKAIKKFKKIASSGFFLKHPNVYKENVYKDEMMTAMQMQQVNLSETRSVFAQDVFPSIQHPIFVINSAFDIWQSCCIWAGAVGNPINGGCGAAKSFYGCAHDIETCSVSQVNLAQQYADDFVATLTSSQTLRNTQNGAFIHTCMTHCEAFTDSWSALEIQGTTMQRAVSLWWNQAQEISGGGWGSGGSRGGNSVAASGLVLAPHREKNNKQRNTNVYLPSCQFHNRTHPRACNPSCPAGILPPSPGSPQYHYWGWCAGQPHRA